jgi:hypothetical protein
MIVNIGQELLDNDDEVKLIIKFFLIDLLLEKDYKYTLKNNRWISN